MQHMPDKDFDKLFKDSFMDAEIEPSADLWGNIAEQLEPKKKRSFPVMWMAAASVAVVASVMLFTKSGEKVYLQGASQEVAVAENSDALQTVPAAITNETDEVSDAVLPAIKSTHTTKKSFVPRLVPVENLDVQKNIIAGVQPSEKNEHLPIKRGEVKPLDVISQETIVKENNEARMIAQVEHTKAENDGYVDPVGETESNIKGIRNVGDLVNYVVDKVDKRDKKIIRFNTDDDDNSSIIGLNIGFLKLNKKNK